jgi:hypothetical protein
MSPSPRRAQVVALIGLAGGVGTSHRALSFAGRAGIAIDLDLATGGLSRQLAEAPVSTLADLTVPQASGILDPRHLGAVTYAHGAGYIVAAPVEPELSELITEQVIVAAIAASALAVERVALDLGARFDQRTLAACARADRIELVVGRKSDVAIDRRISAVVDVLSRAQVFAPIRIVGTRGIYSRLNARSLNRRHGLCAEAETTRRPRGIPLAGAR